MPVGMSYSDIAKQVKEKQSDNLAISIAVQSDMDVVEKNDIDFDSMTVEQMDTYRLEYRNNLKEQHSKSNRTIAAELRLYAMFINYEPAS